MLVPPIQHSPHRSRRAFQLELPDFAATLERLAERHLVRVLEIAAHRKSARDARDPHAERLEKLGQVDGRRLALDARIGRENDFLDPGSVEPRQKLAHPQILGADAVERGKRAKQDVVAPAELAGALEREEIVGLLDDAQDALVSLRVAADAAGILFRDVEADAAVDDARLELG